MAKIPDLGQVVSSQPDAELGLPSDHRVCRTNKVREVTQETEPVLDLNAVDRIKRCVG